MAVLSPAVIAATSTDQFVQLDVPVWAWVALLATIITLLAIDLVRHREDHAHAA